MLITLLSYFGQNNQEFDRGETYGDYSGTSPTGSLTGETMSREDTYYSGDDEGDWEQIRHPVIPLSSEEDYEIILPPSDSPTTIHTVTASSTAGSTGIIQRIKEWNLQRSIQRNQLGPSISTTFAELSKEDPDQLEKDAIQRAMELSMLDVALVHYHHQHDQHRGNHSQQLQQNLPHEILGVARNASMTEIKTAYRKLARLHHPDKGGEAHRFEQIARAYRSLLSSSLLHPHASISTSMNEASMEQIPSLGYNQLQNDEQHSKVIKLTTATCDKELQEHRRLVNDLFRADGMDLEACVTKQLTALGILGLTFKDAGATNRNERNEVIRNSCFYLSLATSYLWGIGALSYTCHEEKSSDNDDYINNVFDTKEEDRLLTGDTALQLKRTIEAAVVKAHPEWVLQGMVGEEVQAFSDFLVYTLDSHTQLSELAVVVFDATSGFCDIYKGRNYDSRKSSLQANTITLRYIPGHYQPLIPCNSSAFRPALKDILSILDDLGVFYVITDGNS